jgi:hypothetical protein
MVQFQGSISKHLHHHTFSNMLFNETSKAHHAQISSCFGLGVNVWLTTWPIFSTFQLSSPLFNTTFCMCLGLPSIIGIPRCVCTHPINPMGIHFLCCVHGNKHIKTHDAICDTFVAITWNVSFHMGRKQLHVLPSTTFNSFRWWINIMFTKDGIWRTPKLLVSLENEPKVKNNEKVKSSGHTP